LFRESFWLLLLAVATVVFVLMYFRFVFLVGVNHDEVEHAHAAFRMLSGEMPYRDFYQNHWPAHWLLVKQFVALFPFSLNAILAGRLVGFLTLIACWWLGLRFVRQLPGGQTQLAMLVYTISLVVFAYNFQFYVARPDNLMTLFATAGLCLVPAQGLIKPGRALGLGLLFGLAISFSSKALPLTLVLPLFMFICSIQSHSFKPLVSVLFYGAGVVLALTPTVRWLVQNDLVSAFYFDVFGLNLAVSKPWYESFELLRISLFLPALLAIPIWFWEWGRSPEPRQNGVWIVTLALICGFILAAIIRHGSNYNMQILIVPLAVSFTCLVSYLHQHACNLGNRILIVAALLAFPLSNTASVTVLFKGNINLLQSELQSIIDLSRPGGRSCIAFSPIHPIWCDSISQLSNGWDLDFAEEISSPDQFQRFQGIWREGIERTIELQPEIILRDSAYKRWEGAVEIGLISQESVDAIDQLAPKYDKHMIGESEFWLKRPEQ
jgi:hypothetical protein